jgi:C-terminal processing protease CtpA/Prc
MRLSLDGIGAVLQSREDYTVIREVVPGGPADKSGKLKVGDRIVGVAQGNGQFTDVMGWRIDDVVQLVRGERLHRAPRRAAGRRRPGRQARQTVSLVRKKISMEEQSAKKSDHPGQGRRHRAPHRHHFAADLLPGLRGAPQGRQGLQERDPRRRSASSANSRRRKSTTS